MHFGLATHSYGDYRIAGKFDKFGESSVIHQTNLLLTIDNLLADLLIRQTFFYQMLEKSQFAKLSLANFPAIRYNNAWTLQK